MKKVRKSQERGKTFMKIIDTGKPKLCHAKVGTVVQIDEDPNYYMVIAFPDGKKGREFQMHGLYDDGRTLFLVNIESGEIAKMPHLSSRVSILHNAALEVSDP